MFSPILRFADKGGLRAERILSTPLDRYYEAFEQARSRPQPPTSPASPTNSNKPSPKPNRNEQSTLRALIEERRVNSKAEINRDSSG